MPRIRSIKPEFWKSDSIAALTDWRDRLTFIGLWSYVDDNGVGIDNYKLIVAELYGQEDDPREVRSYLRECLARLATAGFIIRYTFDGKRYFKVASWEKHQRIDRPNKPRYPQPTHPDAEVLSPVEAAVLDGDGTAPELKVVDGSRDTRETLASVHLLEQGNRGTEEVSTSPTANAEGPSDYASLSTAVVLADVVDGELVDDEPAEDALFTAPKPEQSKRRRASRPQGEDPKFNLLWSVYPRKEGKAEARAAYDRAVAEGADPDQMTEGAKSYGDRMRREGTPRTKIKMAQGWINGKRWEDEQEIASETSVRRRGAWEN